MAFNKIRDFIGGIDSDYEEDAFEDDVVEETATTQASTTNASRPKVVKRPNVLSMDGTNSRGETSKIALYEPRTYADAQTIATQLLAGEAVIVNLSSIDENTGKRVLDYLGGTAFAVDGLIERVGERIFLATPHNFEISGTISQNLGQSFN